MAKRRMFSLSITESDAFTSMPSSSQCLYFHFGMNADDDGVVNNPKSICKIIGANDDDLKILIAKRFIIPIEDSGIIVIKHWRTNNYIQKDRYTPTKYQKELSYLGLDENNAYTVMDTKWIQNGYTDKVRIGKVSIDNNRNKINTHECEEEDILKSDKTLEKSNDIESSSICLDDDEEEEEDDDSSSNSYKIPDSWDDMNSVSKGLYLRTKKRSGESLTEIQEKYLNAFLLSLNKN